VSEALERTGQTPKQSVLSVVATPAVRSTFAALDPAVAAAVGNRAAAALYSVLATKWYEFASPEKLAMIKAKTGRTIVPGDWVSISYRELMEFASTTSKGSIIRWIRVLAEEVHPCPWRGCGKPHPVIVVERLGRNRDNRYRRWRCGEDVLVVRSRIRSEKLKEAARSRFDNDPSANLVLPFGDIVVDDGQDFVLAVSDSLEVSSQDFQPKLCGSPTIGLPGSLTTGLPWKSHYRTSRKSHDRTSLRVKRRYKNKKAAAEKSTITAAALTETTPIAAEFVVLAPKPSDVADDVDDIEAVASEATPLIWELGKRTEEGYDLAIARGVAVLVARALLVEYSGDCERARAALTRALVDRRVELAQKPVALLRRGILGKNGGQDRFLIRSPGTSQNGIRAPAKQASVCEGEEVAKRDRQKREDAALDRQAAAYFDALGAEEREELEAGVAAKLGLGARVRGSVVFFKLVMVEVKRRLGQAPDGRG